MKRLLLVACIALLSPGSIAAQAKSPPKTEAEGQLKLLRDWSLSRTLRARAAQRVFPAWVSAVERHRPGAVDEPAIQISQWPGEDLDLVLKWIYVQLHAGEEARQALGLTPRAKLAALARRGAVLHADIALRAGSRQTSLRISPFTYSIVEGLDGRDAGWGQPGVHLEVGRALLAVIGDARCSDPEFDSLWYAATVSPLLRRRRLGTGEPHLTAGLEQLPDEARLLFYSGAVHEVLAAPRTQRVIEVARIPRQYHWDIGSLERELRKAQRFFDRALARDPENGEIRMHHARVVGQAGDHRIAADELAAVDGKLSDPVLAYYAALFRGEEETALGHREAARAAFERAAALFPTAQSPLLGLSNLARRYGDRAGAVAALKRLFALAAPGAGRNDPWWDYYESHVRDADALMKTLYGRFAQEGTR